MFPIRRLGLWLPSQRDLPHHFPSSSPSSQMGKAPSHQTLSSHDLVLAVASFSTKTWLFTKAKDCHQGVLTSLISRLPLKKDTFTAPEP